MVISNWPLVTNIEIRLQHHGEHIDSIILPSSRRLFEFKHQMATLCLHGNHNDRDSKPIHITNKTFGKFSKLEYKHNFCLCYQFDVDLVALLVHLMAPLTTDGMRGLSLATKKRSIA